MDNHNEYNISSVCRMIADVDNSDYVIKINLSTGRYSLKYIRPEKKVSLFFQTVGNYNEFFYRFISISVIPEDRESIASDFYAEALSSYAANGEKTKLSVYRAYGKNNSIKWIKCKYIFVPDSTGSKYMAILSVKDITDEKIKEISYVAQIDRLTKIIKSTYPLTMTVNLSKNKLLFYSDNEHPAINESYYDVSENFVQCVRQEDVQKYKDFMNPENAIKRLEKSGVSVLDDVRYISADGKMKHISVTFERNKNYESNDIIATVIFRKFDQSDTIDASVRDFLNSGAISGLSSDEITDRCLCILKEHISDMKSQFGSETLKNIIPEVVSKLSQVSEMRNVDSQFPVIRVISDIREKILSISLPEKSINEVLAILGGYFRSRGVIVWLYNPEKTVLSNEYGWFADGKKNEDISLQLENKHIRRWLYGVSENRSAEDYVFNDFDGSLSNEIFDMDIKSMIAYPLKNGSEIYGFITCIDSENTFTNNDDLFAVVSYFVVNALQRAENFAIRRAVDAQMSVKDEFFRNIYDSMHNSLIHFTDTCNIHISDANNAFYDMTGFTRSEIKEKFSDNFAAIIYYEDLPSVQSAIRQVSENSQNVSIEYRVVCKSGDMKWLISNFCLTINSNEEVIYQCESTDVTKSKLEHIENEIAYINMPGYIAKYAYTDKCIFLDANEKFYSFFGTSRQNYKDNPFYGVHSEYLYELDSMIKKVLAGEEEQLVVCCSKFDGSDVWVQLSVKYIGIQNGAMVYLAVFSDITDIKLKTDQLTNMNFQLNLQTQKYKLIEECTDEITCDYDVANDVLIIPSSDGKENLSVYENCHKKGFFKRHIFENDYKKFSSSFENAMSSPEKGSVDVRVNIFEGKFLWYRIIYVSVSDDKGKVTRIVARIKNIENEKLEQQIIENKINTDPMTGFYNKIKLQFLVDEIISSSDDSEKCYALIMMDIDSFKSINDNFGHTFGDTVIRNVALSIKNIFRSTDIFGRVGGDEFVIFMEGAERNIVELKVKALCETMRREYDADGTPVVISCSIGAACSRGNSENYETLFKNADAAMYNSKQSGKNTYTFYSNDIKQYAEDSADRRRELDIVALYDVSFVAVLFNMLADSPSIEKTMPVLLRKIGERFNLDVVYLLKMDYTSEIHTAFITDVWQREEHIKIEKVRGYNWNLLKDAENFYNETMLVIEDCSDSIYDSLRWHFDDFGFKSLANVRFYDNVEDACSITFGDCRGTRKWSEYDKNTFKEITKTVSAFMNFKNEKMRDKQTIQLLSTTDPITGIYNLDRFKSLAAEFVKENAVNNVCAIVYTDINNFSYINDNFGYYAGDNMLRDFAELLSKTEHICCRAYSDYFLCLCCSDSRESIMQSVNEINTTFVDMQKRHYPASDIYLSTGICFVEPDDIENINYCIDNADLARKATKVSRKGDIKVFDEALRQQRSHDLKIVGDMYRAMEKGLIEPFLQPKFSISKRTIIGAEALSRWRNPDGTLKFPDQFIPALEKIGYIVQLDFYIFEEVLKRMKKWSDDGKPLLPISVNFSRLHMNYDNFYEHICELTDKYNIDKKYIEIEVTETTFISDTSKMLDILNKLRDIGFKIDIDDFGTGYSSLNLLTTAPVDIVKLDKCFLQDIDKQDNEKGRAYIKQLCRLISTVNREIIFEGVETDSQADFLVNCGFDMAQGYLFDKPIPISEFESKYLYCDTAETII